MSRLLSARRGSVPPLLVCVQHPSCVLPRHGAPRKLLSPHRLHSQVGSEQVISVAVVVIIISLRNNV